MIYCNAESFSITFFFWAFLSSANFTANCSSERARICTANSARDKNRAQQRQSVVGLDDEGSISSDMPGPERLAVSSELSEQLNYAMALNLISR